MFETFGIDLSKESIHKYLDLLWYTIKHVWYELESSKHYMNKEKKGKNMPDSCLYV